MKNLKFSEKATNFKKSARYFFDACTTTTTDLVFWTDLSRASDSLLVPSACTYDCPPTELEPHIVGLFGKIFLWKFVCLAPSIRAHNGNPTSSVKKDFNEFSFWTNSNSWSFVSRARFRLPPNRVPTTYHGSVWQCEICLDKAAFLCFHFKFVVCINCYGTT